MTTGIKTVLHTYEFNISKEEDRAAYEALRATLKAQGLKCFESWSPGKNSSHWLGEDWDGTSITLETDHVFDNQWNTAPIDGLSEKGLRVFDWAQDATGLNILSPNIKRGHWLEQTREMQEIRDNTTKCGYCGKQEPAAKGYVFCPHCLDSEYLTAKDLPLTRMKRVSDSEKRAPLTEAESAHLLPLYRAAQLHGTTARGKARIAKQRADIAHEFATATRNATTKRDGLLWLLDHGLSIDNVIFYSHTGRFGFGWRKPIEAEILSEILNVISEFNFPYDIETADGRKLSGN